MCEWFIVAHVRVPLWVFDLVYLVFNEMSEKRACGTMPCMAPLLKHQEVSVWFNDTDELDCTWNDVKLHHFTSDKPEPSANYPPYNYPNDPISLESLLRAIVSSIYVKGKHFYINHLSFFQERKIVILSNEDIISEQENISILDCKCKILFFSLIPLKTKQMQDNSTWNKNDFTLTVIILHFWCS